MTNAEKLQTMSIEELADWLYLWGTAAPNCDRESGVIDYKSCRDCWYSWLKQEVGNV